MMEPNWIKVLCVVSGEKHVVYGDVYDGALLSLPCGGEFWIINGVTIVYSHVSLVICPFCSGTHSHTPMRRLFEKRDFIPLEDPELEAELRAEKEKQLTL